MKNIKFLLFGLVLAINVQAQQKITEGVVVSKETMTSNNEEMNEVLKGLEGGETITYFKESKMRTESSNGKYGKSTIIIDGNKLQTLTLVSNEVIGNKYKLESDNIDKTGLAKFNLVEQEEVRTILGYHCKKVVANVNQNGVEVKIEIYLTEELPSIVNPKLDALLGKLKGFPLYIEIAMHMPDGVMKTVSEVTSIKAQKVTDNMFSLVPPDGYTKM